MEDLPAVQRALVAGSIDMPKVLVICDGVQGLALPVARAVVEKVLARAAEQTTGQLRAREDSKGRRVEVFLNDNQLAAIAGYELAPHRVAAGWERLTAIAKAAKAAGDGRRMDQLRADALLDLLAGERGSRPVGRSPTAAWTTPMPMPMRMWSPPMGRRRCRRHRRTRTGWHPRPMPDATGRHRLPGPVRPRCGMWMANGRCRWPTCRWGICTGGMWRAGSNTGRGRSFSAGSVP
jgi:hypothetical protein